jgi:ubiquinone/menaquinone biosynthesis C-methylase UbiE
MAIVPNSKDSRREHPSTYIVQDRSSEKELTRLYFQDQVINAGMYDFLIKQPVSTNARQVLDVGCGTGGWLIEMAKAHPATSSLVGVDISQKMIEYAREQAQSEQVSERLEFTVMDALDRLDFPDASFDLVNQRLGAAYLRTWNWSLLLAEYRRVCSPGGIIRVIELDAIVENSSPALTRLMQLFTEAFRQAGHFFPSDEHGVTSELAGLLRWQGLQDVQTDSHLLEYRAGTPEGQLFAENMQLVYRTALPFFRKWTRVPSDYEDMYQQMVRELQEPDFIATWHIVSAWGTNAG